MLKLLLFTALVANIFIIVSSTGKHGPSKQHDDCDDNHHGVSKIRKGPIDNCAENHGKPKPHKIPIEDCKDNHHDKPKPHDDCKDNHHNKPKPHDDCDDKHHNKPKPHDDCDDNHHNKPKPHDDCDDNHHDKPRPHKQPHDDCDDNHHNKPKPTKKPHDDCDDNHHNKPKPTKKPHDDCDDNHHNTPKPTKKPSDDCTDECTGDNEYYDTCPPSCPPQTCDSIGKVYHCPIQPAVCKPACRCIKDYYRNSEGKCVPEKDCDCEKCEENEMYVDCPAFTCQPKTCDELGFPQPCPIQVDNATCPVKPACLCVNGYLRNKKGVCVPTSECPSCGGDENAQAGCGLNCGRHCSDYKNTKPAICPRICKPNSCDCKPDFVFDDNTEKCVAPKDCTPTCKDNEVFSNCTNGGCFGARNCCDKGKPEICVKIDPASCKKGCLCEDGYLRNDDGVCIPEDQCPFTCKNPHEVYDACPPLCPAQKCSVDTRLIKCGHNPSPGDPECEPSCRCIEGYLRDDEGVCIPKEQCPPFCGQNEVPSNCTNGGCFGARTCSEKGKPVRCVKLDPASCKKGCICEDGYLRNDDGVCIPEDECPCECKENESYVECPDFSCGPKTCDQLGFPQPCPDHDDNATCPGKPACLCVSGYVRNNKGVCVPVNECPSCGGDCNAQSGCGINCGRHCSNYKNKNTVCPLICKFNSCDCKPDFVYDDNIEKCVAPKDCTPTCGENEVFSNCTNGGCFGARTCSEKGKPEICAKIDPADCKKGCLCEDGYLRNDDGVCIPEDQCPCTQCTEPNEEWDYCPDTCPPQTCDSLGKKYNCPLQTVPKTNCKGACRCKSGYYRNALQQCVSEEDCKKCPADNEYYDMCPPSCPPQTCDSLGKKYNCPIQAAVCKPACRCIKDYYRNCNGTCVPEKECTPECTQPNEEYQICPVTCPPQTCEAIGKTIHCPLIKVKCDGQGSCRCKSGFYRNALNQCISKENCLKCSGPNEYYSCGGACDNVCATLSQQNQTNCPIVNIKCNEMCYCKEGYARDANKKCIPIEDCPKSCGCNGDPNAHPGCGVNCGRLCSNYDSPDEVACIDICYENACDCNDGYVFDENTKKCVLPEQCTPTCGVNEEYSTCTQAVCRLQDCTQKGQSVSCPRVKEGACKKGCVCKENYLRAQNGTCVPEDQCDTCPDGEIYNTCPPEKCDAENCPVSRDSPTACKSPKNCGKPRCTCGFNQKRDRKSGKCIAIRDCPPFKCDGPNEEYQSCPPVCPGENCSDFINKTTCPKFKIGIVVPCTPQCRCKKNFYRNDDGVCVCSSECVKKPTCGPNEEYSKCDEKCVCKKNYYRAKDGTCVPDDDDDCGCDDDNDCPDGETYNTCPPEKCDAEYCPSSRNSPTSCKTPKNCGKPRCLCGFNQKRNRKTGKCIAIKDCPPFKCDGPNEVYQSCPPVCPGQNCSDFINKTTCPKFGRIGIVVPCTPQCRCKENFYRNDDGVCVCSSECVKKPTCGPNEEFSKCHKKCVCKDNYYRADDGTCVPEDDDDDCGCDD